MFYDVIPHQTTSELHLFIDLTYHALISHAKVCLSFTMVCMSCVKVCLLHEESVCHVPLIENDAKSLSKAACLIALNMYLTLHLLLF